MRSKNPEVMNAICTFVDQYYREHHASPSVNEIAQGVGVSKATSYRYLVAMNERGMLSYDGKTIVTKQVGKCTSGYFSAPVVGSIRCGDPEREEESVEEYVSLPKSIFGEGKFYILRAKGDSMVDAGIEDEDLIVIRIQDTAAVGDIVVALDEDNENTLKIFGGIDEENGEVSRQRNSSEAAHCTGRGKTRHQGPVTLAFTINQERMCSDNGNLRCTLSNLRGAEP